VNAVIREISAEHAANLRDETPEATATRMMDFLFKVLNYQQASLAAAFPHCCLLAHHCCLSLTTPSLARGAEPGTRALQDWTSAR